MNKFVGYEKESKSGSNWAFFTLLIGHCFLSQLCLLMKIVLEKLLVDYLVYLYQLLVCGKLPPLSLNRLASCESFDWSPFRGSSLEVCRGVVAHICNTELLL